MLLLSPFELNLIEDNNYDEKSKNFVHKRQAREFDLLRLGKLKNGVKNNIFLKFYTCFNIKEEMFIFFRIRNTEKV